MEKSQVQIKNKLRGHWLGTFHCKNRLHIGWMEIKIIFLGIIFAKPENL